MRRIHQFIYWIADAQCSGTINGFPILETGLAGGSGGIPLDPYLIGKDNVLRLEILRAGEAPRVRMEVRAMDPGDLCDPCGLPDARLPDSIPGAIERRFDSETDHFARILARAAPSDALAMVAFGMRLRDAFRAGNAQALRSFFRPKIEVIAALMEAPAATIEASLGTMLGEFEESDLRFGPEDLEALPHCGGKVWEIRRKDRRPLLDAPDPEGNGHRSLQVFAADLGGGPAIVA